jgi:hypothetical protein
MLTWIILPLMQSYANAGEFSIAGKLKTGWSDIIIRAGYRPILCIGARDPGGFLEGPGRANGARKGRGALEVGNKKRRRGK